MQETRPWRPVETEARATSLSQMLWRMREEKKRGIEVDMERAVGL
jgi:hypothetical protein